MASTNSNQKRKDRSGLKRKLTTILAIVAAILSFLLVLQEETYPRKEQPAQMEEDNTSLKDPMTVHFVDVGQGDCTVITDTLGNVIVIDCGEVGQGDEVEKYLKSIGVDHINVLIGTHPHSDHLGGMAYIVENYEIDTIYLPDTGSKKITTQYYKNLLTAIKTRQENSDGKFKVTYPKVGQTIQLGEINIQFLAPSQNKYSNANNYSIATRISYGDVDVMLTGDAEALSENEILETGLKLDSEVMSAGHHGSDTSNSKDFLDAVAPEYIVISAGVGNSYRHPIKSVMEYLEESEIAVFRTDEQGNIVMTTDGINIKFNVSPGSYLSGPELEAKEND